MKPEIQNIGDLNSFFASNLGLTVCGLFLCIAGVGGGNILMEWKANKSQNDLLVSIQVQTAQANARSIENQANLAMIAEWGDSHEREFLSHKTTIHDGVPKLIADTLETQSITGQLTVMMADQGRLERIVQGYTVNPPGPTDADDLASLELEMGRMCDRLDVLKATHRACQ